MAIHPNAVPCSMDEELAIACCLNCSARGPVDLLTWNPSVNRGKSLLVSVPDYFVNLLELL